jgi:hypothetical protein
MLLEVENIMNNNNINLFIDKYYKFYKNISNITQSIYENIIETQEQAIQEFSTFTLEQTNNLPFVSREKHPPLKKNKGKKKRIGMQLAIGLMSLLNTSSIFAADLIGAIGQKLSNYTYSVNQANIKKRQKDKDNPIEMRFSFNDMWKLYQNNMKNAALTMQQLYKANPLFLPLNPFRVTSKGIEASKIQEKGIPSPALSKVSLKKPIIRSEPLKISKKLAPAPEPEEIYKRNIKTPLTQETYKPSLTTKHLDVLKELKVKFASSEKPLKPSSIQVKSLNEVSDALIHTPTGSFLIIFIKEKRIWKSLFLKQ